jgi:hypothetical protein
MNTQISVINIRKPVKPAQNTKFFYVGRASKGYKGSPLGNPFKIGEDGNREEVIQKYRQWLFAEIKNEKSDARKELFYIAFVALSRNILLGCWCHPQRCHAEIIKRAVQWLISTEQVKETEVPVIPDQYITKKLNFTEANKDLVKHNIALTEEQLRKIGQLELIPA